MTTVTTMIRLVFAVPILLMETGLAADPSAPAPPAPILRHTYRLKGQSYSPYGTCSQPNLMSPGTNIPPCDMVFGYTDRGPTDQDGHLLKERAYAPPQWTFIAAPLKTQRR